MSYIPSAPHLGGTPPTEIRHDRRLGIRRHRILHDKVAGDYQLQFNRGVPSQIVIYNFPFATSTNNLYSQAVYVTDTYTIEARDAECRCALGALSQLLSGTDERGGAVQRHLPRQDLSRRQDVLTWTDTVPRAGAAWDVMGNGKTVVKGSFGLFGDTMGDLYANAFNPNAQATQTYAWTGPCVTTKFKNNTFNNTSCDVTPAFLASLPVADAA